jgi:hypothetical protein
MARKRIKSKPEELAPVDPPTPPIPDSLDEPPARQKAALRLLQRAVTHGWEIPEAVWQAAPDVCARILNDDLSQSRDRLRAAEVLAAMARDKVNAAIALDKMERLDEGEATERVVISPEIEARAREIIARRLGNA